MMFLYIQISNRRIRLDTKSGRAWWCLANTGRVGPWSSYGPTYIYTSSDKFERQIFRNMQDVKRRWKIFTMTDKGAAYIIMLPTMEMLPIMAALFLGSWTKVRTIKPSATIKISSTMTIKITFILCLRSEYNKNSVRYTISMPRPVPLIVITKRLLRVTHGRPYITQSPQLINVARYGIGENCSTDLLFHIRTKVVL